MYSPLVIERRRLAIQKHLGWLPERSSPERIEWLKAQIDKVTPLDDKGRPTIGVEDLPPDLAKLVQNEIVMCRLDFCYWGRNYAVIRSSEDKLIPFIPTKAQQIALSMWADLEERSLAIFIIQLKARQLGMSSLTEMAICHRVQFYPDVKAVVASSDPRKSERMAQMMFLCWDQQPWWIKPKQERDKAGEYAKFSHRSEIYIEHGSRNSGIARGTTPSVVHLSELPDWPNPKELIDSALMRAIHPDPFKMVILESTAKGLHNWWHNKWLASQKWPRSLFRPMFLPWFTDDMFWPTPTWLRQNPVPAGWRPKPETIAHAEKAAVAVRDDALLSAHFPRGWRMPLEKMYFYECDKDEHIKEKDLAGFLSEMPANHIEAFQSTAYSIFSVDIIDFHTSQCRPPVALYGFVGDMIPLSLQPSRYEMDFSYETDPDAPRPIKVDVKWSEDPSNCFTVTLVPLIMDDLLSESEPDCPFGKLLVWEMPQRGEEYGFGVDTAEGIGLDRTVVEGMKKGIAGLRRNEQVCEFASPYVNSMDLWPILMTIATLYSTEQDGERRQSKVVIECAGNGELSQLEMMKRGWWNFHIWLRYDNRRLNRARSTKYGWFTNSWSRPMIIDHLVKSLRDDWLIINSIWFVEEMKDLEKDEDDVRAEAAYGGHDDRIMAMAMVQFSMWDTTTYYGSKDMRIRKTYDPRDDYPRLSLSSYTSSSYPSPSDYLEGEHGYRYEEDRGEMEYEYD